MRMARLNNEDISECHDDNNVITRNFPTIIIIIIISQVYRYSIIFHPPTTTTTTQTKHCRGFKVATSKLFNLGGPRRKFFGINFVQAKAGLLLWVVA